MSADHKVESPDHSLSIAEAAAHLSVAPATIRRRIKTGELGAFKRTTAYGFEWRILLEPASEALITSPDQHVITPTQKPDQVVESADLRLALELAEQLRRDNAALVARNEQMAGQLGYLQRQVLEQQETIQRLLMAPKDEPAEPEPPAEPVRVSWWRRLLGG